MNLIPYLEAIAESDDVYTVLSQSGFTTQAAQAMQQLQQQIPMSVAYRPVRLILIHNRTALCILLSRFTTTYVCNGQLKLRKTCNSTNTDVCQQLSSCD